MDIISLNAKNFLSFQDVSYKLKLGKPVLIQGENLTDDGQESNGSGKSALMSIIEYCILHYTSRGVNDKDLIFWGEDSASLSLTIYCPIRQETLFIERDITEKGGRSQLSINDQIKFAFADKMVNEIDRFIIEWIGISKEDLLNYFILSKFKYTSFFDSSNTKLVQLIGRFSNSSIIDGLDKEILEEVNIYEQKRTELLGQKNRLEGRIEAHNSNIITLNSVDKEKLVEEKLAEIDTRIFEQHEAVVHWNTQVGIANDKISSFYLKLKEQLIKLSDADKQIKGITDKSFDKQYEVVDAQINEVNQKKEGLTKKVLEMNNNANEIKLVLQGIERNIRGSVECPNCHFEFIVGEEGIDINKEKEAKKDAEILLTQVSNSITQLRNSVEELSPTLLGLKKDRIGIEAEENEFRTLKRNLQNSLLVLEKEKGNIELEIQHYNGSISLFENNIKECENRVLELKKSKGDVTVDLFDNTARIESINTEIQTCEDGLKKIEETDKGLQEEIFNTKKWAYSFKEFSQHLSVKTLKIIQSYANKFLQDIGSDLRITLEGYKLKANGEMSDKITAYILRDGIVKEFGSFSGGERVRLEAAMILTIQYAINSTHKFGGLHFLSIDEIFESADRAGITSLTTALEGLGRTMLITTHIPGNTYTCEVLRVVKTNKISTLVIQ